jgi:hypothetical protein
MCFHRQTTPPNIEMRTREIISFDEKFHRKMVSKLINMSENLNLRVCECKPCSGIKSWHKNDIFNSSGVTRVLRNMKLG